MAAPTRRYDPAVVIAVAICVALLGLGLIAGLVVLVIFAPDGTDLPAIFAALTAAVVAIGGAAANYLKSRQLEGTVAEARESVRAVDEKVDYLANGGTDAKMRAGIADVIPESMLKTEYVTDQLDADRAHRDATPASRHAAAIEAAEALLVPHLITPTPPAEPVTPVTPGKEDQE